jgi:hypothetical protein
MCLEGHNLSADQDQPSGSEFVPFTSRDSATVSLDSSDAKQNPPNGNRIPAVKSLIHLMIKKLLFLRVLVIIWTKAAHINFLDSQYIQRETCSDVTSIFFQFMPRIERYIESFVLLIIKYRFCRHTISQVPSDKCVWSCVTIMDDAFNCSWQWHYSSGAHD